MKTNKPFIGVHIVPTGIGATIGGFAGDAGPANALLASCCDLLVSNPNIINAATLYNLPPNVLYTEGYFIDQLFKGEIALSPVRNNRIGIIFDNAMPEDVYNINLNAAHACVKALGINIIACAKTAKPLEISYSLSSDGISTGSIANTSTLLEAAHKLIKEGAEAIAVVGYFPAWEEEDVYAHGRGADPIGMIEAVISHMVAREFMLPCAHAPAFPYEDLLPGKTLVDPRAASEYFSPTFLPCILAGLHKAPHVIAINQMEPDHLHVEDVDCLVMPHNALGSIPVIASVEKDIDIIAVKENTAMTSVTAEHLGISSFITKADTYFEAAGILMARKNGINFLEMPIRELI